MPTYEYACTACQERLEVVQSFTEDAWTVCPTCGGRLRKVFSPAGIIFKGAGFYRTDSRSGAKAASNGAGKKSESDGSGSKTATADAKGTESKGSDSSSSSDGGKGSGGSGGKGSGGSGGGSAASSSSEKVA